MAKSKESLFPNAEQRTLIAAVEELAFATDKLLWAARADKPVDVSILHKYREIKLRMNAVTHGVFDYLKGREI